MCLIIHHPAGHTISRHDFADIARRNPDGFGLMTSSSGVLHTFRTIGTIADAHAMYMEHGAGRASVLHWRFATHGTVSLDNAHPFTLTPDIAFVHNGMLTCGTPDEDASDTAHLARAILAPIARDNPDALFNPEFRAVLSPLIGIGNKLAVMDRHGRVSIFNRASGMDHKGRWYSNAYAWSAPRPAAPSAPVYGLGSYGGWRYPSPAPVAPSQAVLSLTTGRPWDDAPPNPAGSLEQAALDGEGAVLTWCLENPTEAVELVADWYTLDADGIADKLDTDPAAVAEWCYEIAIAAR